MVVRFPCGVFSKGWPSTRDLWLHCFAKNTQQLLHYQAKFKGTHEAGVWVSVGMGDVDCVFMSKIMIILPNHEPSPPTNIYCNSLKTKPSGLINSFTLRRCTCNIKWVIFKLMSRIDILSISCEIHLKWMPQDLNDDKSTLVQVMAWCLQAMLSHVDPDLCCHMASLSHNEFIRNQH